MIVDSLKNCDKYASVHPRFAKAFDFLKSADLKSLEPGKIELEGSDLVVNVVNLKAKSVDEAKMEAHKQFIDIQIPVSAAEYMGWKALGQCEEILNPYDEEKDLIFYADKASIMLHIQPLEFAVFFPEDAHQPGIGEGEHLKIIVKVRV